MRILLFTAFSCIACDAHRKEVTELLRKEMISLNVYDIDDERYFSITLAAMRKWNVSKTPSIAVLDETGQLIATIQGINHSLEKLRKVIADQKQIVAELEEVLCSM